MSLNVLAIMTVIAVLSQQDSFIHKDPADRLIAATAIVYKAPLISADAKLVDIQTLNIIW